MLRFVLHHIDLFLFVALCLLVPVLAARAWITPWLRRRRGRPPRHGRTRWVWTGLLLLELGCLLHAWLVEPDWLEVTRHTLRPAGMNGRIRMVQLSDLHLDGHNAFDRAVLDAVRAASPDVVVLTGDYLNDRREAGRLEALLDELAGVAGRSYVFAVSGNFEADGAHRAAFARAGVPLLDGTLVTVTRRGAALQLAGIGHHPQPRAERLLAGLARQVEPAVPAVLLHHTPDLAESPGIEAFDLVLCGHTHGGQVRLPLYGALITLSRFGKRYEAGMAALPGGGLQYTSRGLGCEPAPVPRVRFLCRPELAVFDLVSIDVPSRQWQDR